MGWSRDGDPDGTGDEDGDRDGEDGGVDMMWSSVWPMVRLFYGWVGGAPPEARRQPSAGELASRRVGAMAAHAGRQQQLA